MFITSYPVSGQSLASYSSFLPIKNLHHQQDHPQPLLFQAEQSQFFQLLFMSDYPLPTLFLCPFTAPTAAAPCLIPVSPELQMNHPRTVYRRRNSSASLLSMPCLQLWRPLTFFAAKAQCWLVISFLSFGTHRFLSVVLLPILLFSLCTWESFLDRRRTLHFFLLNST